MIFIGIDPGGGGGLAFLGGEGQVVGVHKMPETERDLLETLRMYSLAPIKARAVLERVNAGPKMASRAAFTFGQGYGRLRMALVCLEIPFDQVTPQAWQKALSCRTQGDKAVSKARAQELFSVPVFHWNADALLLAEYGRRVQLGIAPPPPSEHPVAPRPGRTSFRAMTAKGDAF